MDNNKKEILTALEKYNGIVTNACGSIGLPRSTYYKWLSEDSDFKEAVNEIQEVAIDFVEGKLMQKISGDDILGVPPSDTAIIFYLKTKGKHRGYIERIEQQQVGSIDVKLSKESIESISKNLDDAI